MLAEAPDSDFAPPSFADSPTARIVLVADDLTGACDAGAAFLVAARTVRVWFGTSVLYSAPRIRPGLQHRFVIAFAPPRRSRGIERRRRSRLRS